MRISANPLRGQQFPAVLLLVAAGLGLLLANLPTHDLLATVLDFHIAVPGTDIDLSIAHWVSDGLLAIFFLVVAVELRHELTHGELDSPRKALQPAIAAAGGVVVPIAVYLLIAGDSATATGWPIPTATDIAFALLSRMLHETGHVGIAIAMGVIGIATWGLVAASGIHATIAGVMLGLVMSPVPAGRARHALEPTVNGAILPLFAFVAAFVVIPALSPTELSPAFWGIAVALPVGKIIGISLFGWVAMRIRPKGTEPALPFADLLSAGALGGIGFTVSLLLANLAFASDDSVRDQAILGVLVGSLVALALSGVIVSLRARWYRQVAAATS
ncbi:MAG TPA: Na+/H+ antiporter NhaA [Microbacterium sp.]|nr:Na+/H+ antiporter NhaA [Microbacterium sp.]